jgi:hypothetical protein
LLGTPIFSNVNRRSNGWVINSAWNGSGWVIAYHYTYDPNNFEISHSYRTWGLNGTVITGGDSTYYYFHTVVGINDIAVPLESITIYPNPTTSQITIETPATTQKNTILTIYNLSGQLITTRQITEPSSTIDISSLIQGVYFVRLTDYSTVQFGKFVKN